MTGCKCPLCQEHLGRCYYSMKVAGGLFKNKDSSRNGKREALSEREWLILGVDLNWPPPPEPNVAPAERWLLYAEAWEPTDRESSFLARELVWLQRIGAEDLE